MSTTTHPEFLIYGANGYLGSHIVTALRAQAKTFEIGKARIENKASLEAEIDSLRPKYVICAAGLAGKPNVVRDVIDLFKKIFLFKIITKIPRARCGEPTCAHFCINGRLIMIIRRIGSKIRRTSPRLFGLTLSLSSMLLMFAMRATCTVLCWAPV